MTRLAEAVETLKARFRLQTTFEPNMLLIPRRAAMVKQFAADLAEEEPDAGSAPIIFDQLWRLERGCTYRDLNVVLSDVDDDMTVDRDVSEDLSH